MPASGRFKMAFLAALLLTNYAEATFKALHPFFFMTFAMVLDYPQTVAAVAQTRPFVTLRQPRTPAGVKSPPQPRSLPTNVAARGWRSGQAGRR